MGTQIVAKLGQSVSLAGGLVASCAQHLPSGGAAVVTAVLPGGRFSRRAFSSLLLSRLVPVPPPDGGHVSFLQQILSFVTASCLPVVQR